MKTAVRAKNHVDMLHGPLFGKIFMFALPLIASGVLQQSFNAVDVAVIGRYSSSVAIAAVGSNGPIISILVNLFIGIAVGANVVIANYIGQNKLDKIRESVSTVAIISLISGIILLIAGSVLTRPILEAMSAPAEVIDLAVTYLRIFFYGMPFMMIYNFGGAILRSVGDTNKLFYSLFIATLCNLFLDWIFVAFFGWGVEGVAWATVIANGVNAAIMIWYLTCEPDPITLKFKHNFRRFSMSDLSRMLHIGIPAGLQGMVFSISNIFIQSEINKFGADAIAGSAAALTYEAYCYYIVVGFCGAALAFTGQNFGAGDFRRCRRIWAISMACSVVFCGIANFLGIYFENQFIHIFTTDPQVMHYAFIRFHIVMAFQAIASSYEVSASYMRGMGYSVIPMLLTIFGTCVLRLFWCSIFTNFGNTFSVLLSIYPITWIITGIAVVAAAFMVQHHLFRNHAPLAGGRAK